MLDRIVIILYISPIDDSYRRTQEFHPNHRKNVSKIQMNIMKSSLQKINPRVGLYSQKSIIQEFCQK